MFKIRVYHYEWYENEDYEWTECEIFVHSEEQAREMLPSLAKKYPECYITLDNKDGENIAFYYSVKGKLKEIGVTLL